MQYNITVCLLVIYSSYLCIKTQNLSLEFGHGQPVRELPWEGFAQPFLVQCGTQQCELSI